MGVLTYAGSYDTRIVYTTPLRVLAKAAACVVPPFQTHAFLFFYHGTTHAAALASTLKHDAAVSKIFWLAPWKSI